MQESLFHLLRCPYAKQPLRIQIISKKQRQFNSSLVEIIEEAILFSEEGFVFPVIDGIPRMLIESIYDYDTFLKQHLPNYLLLKKQLEEKHADLLAFCREKNKKTKQSFFLEWGFLKPQANDKLWHDEIADLSYKFLQEFDLKPEDLKGKAVIDVGCGHGVTTGKIATLSQLVVGVELSRAVENAYSRNDQANAHFLQGDLLFLPFAERSFDLLYSSGVLHHTADTKKSLVAVEALVKKNGKICIWLYHPQSNKIHNAMLFMRKVTSKMPVAISFPLLMIFVFPFSFLIKKIKRKRKLNYREEIIDILDMFTPEFRFEITHNEAEKWLTELNYSDVKVTTTDQFGFSIVGKNVKES
ncbi:methyltransferase domain-containing protein [Lacibacter luteus]|uniref:Methyltransferase domain-containing protein n=1 Tax=Lacibacter luteus TaxID=2508719 RepID=A0A4Q1CIR7_9BACT|nr:methyltransferase domain-containing protein [Lacibacter luteus]RXK60510.1 methyltransferase domain-containing protein [Lacibacter luteus]